VLEMLRRRDQAAGEIAQSFPVSRPAISKHLRVLLRAKLVRERRLGRHRIYQLNPQPLQAVDQWLAEYREFWTTKLGHLKSYIESEQRSPSTRQKRSRPRTSKQR
jgi:DNA-binding transcriptional ArsR family regulator